MFGRWARSVDLRDTPCTGGARGHRLVALRDQQRGCKPVASAEEGGQAGRVFPNLLLAMPLSKCPGSPTQCVVVLRYSIQSIGDRQVYTAHADRGTHARKESSRRAAALPPTRRVTVRGIFNRVSRAVSKKRNACLRPLQPEVRPCWKAAGVLCRRCVGDALLHREVSGLPGMLCSIGGIAISGFAVRE